MLWTIIRSARPWSFVLSATTVCVATMVALREGSFHAWRFLLVLVGMICAHAAMNLLNDYFDVRHGVDAPGVATARYRPHPLIEGRLRPRHILASALVLYVVGIGIGVGLAARVGWSLVLVITLGFLVSYFYTGDPINFKGRAMGELVMFVATGPLMVSGAYFAQTGSWAKPTDMLLISIPMGLWWTLPLVANNMRDAETDRRAPGGTLAVRLGRRGSLVFYAALAAVIYGTTALGVLIGSVPVWGLAVFATLPPMISLIRRFALSATVPEDADPQTVRIEIWFAGLLVAAYLLEHFSLAVSPS